MMLSYSTVELLANDGDEIALEIMRAARNLFRYVNQFFTVAFWLVKGTMQVGLKRRT